MQIKYTGAKAHVDEHIHKRWKSVWIIEICLPVNLREVMLLTKGRFFLSKGKIFVL